MVPVSAVGQRASALRGQPLEPFCRGQNESFLVTYQEPVTESVEESSGQVSWHPGVADVLCPGLQRAEHAAGAT